MKKRFYDSHSECFLSSPLEKSTLHLNDGKNNKKKNSHNTWPTLQGFQKKLSLKYLYTYFLACNSRILFPPILKILFYLSCKKRWLNRPQFFLFAFISQSRARWIVLNSLVYSYLLTAVQAGKNSYPKHLKRRNINKFSKPGSRKNSHLKGEKNKLKQIYLHILTLDKLTTKN